ncbi:MAG: amidase [bacterium]|nr:amidase [Gammaproteobacteria bacterium]
MGLPAMLLIVLLSACADNSQETTAKELPETDMKFTIKELHISYQNRTLTVVDVTQHFLDEIEKQNPELNAVISVNPGALDAAAEQDQQLSRGETPGRLFGIPVLIKDNIETKELPTTAGSLALKNNDTQRDAELVIQLRNAGAIILGKANLSEWANFRSQRSSSGWSALGGQTRNPHDTTRSPCGSSSGSAVAVAAQLAIVAVGTETDGSVVCPASLTGIVGIKPSMGLVSQIGIIPIAHTQDTAGPMASNVEDAAILLNAMAINNKGDFAAGFDRSALVDKRIGILRSSAGFHEGVDAVFENSISVLRSAGSIIIDDLKIDLPQKFSRDSYEVLLYEFKHDIEAYLTALPNKAPNNITVSNLQDLIQFNEAQAEREMAYFKQEIFVKSEAKGSLTDQEYITALARIRQATREDGLDRLLQQNQLDALVSPTAGAAWKIDLINGDNWPGGGPSSFPAISGYPHITVPMGNLQGLPLGLSFMAGSNSDKLLLDIAFAFEQHRLKPIPN